MLNGTSLLSLSACLALGLAAASAQEGRVLVVDQASPAASDAGSGSQEAPFKTISKAASLAGPGDTVLVHRGVYRERISPSKGGAEGKPVVYMAVPGEEVVVKGSELWHPELKPLEGAEGVFEAALDPALFKDGVNPYAIELSISGNDPMKAARPADPKKLPHTLGQLFLDGSPMVEAEDVEAVKLSPNSWAVAPEGGKLLLHFPDGVKSLAGHNLELTVRNRLFAPRGRGLGFIHVKGFVFEHSATQGPFPQGGAVSVRSGHDWLIEGNTIRLSKTVGLDCGSEYWDGKQIPDTDEADRKLIIGGRHLIKGNTISDNGLCGIAGWNHHGTVIVGNIVERNDTANFYTGFDAKWEEWAGIKMHGTDALIEGNIVRDNEGHGIWIDNGYENARITRNLVVNNRMSGIFLELGAGPCLIDNNIVAFTRPLGYVDRPGGDFYTGFGIYTHDASDVIIAHNLLASNSGTGVLMRTITDRQAGGRHVETSHERIINNIFYDNGRGAIILPYPSQYSKGNLSDFNLILPRVAGELFAVNEFKECPPGKNAVAALEASLKESGASQKDWPNLEKWTSHPVLDLRQWQGLMGMDKNSSEIPKQISIFLRPRAPSVSIKVDKKFLEAKSIDTEIVAYDYLGFPRPEGKALPGPFQNLKEGMNNIQLWPLRTGPDTSARNYRKSMLANIDRYLLKPDIPALSGETSVDASFDLLATADDSADGIWTSARQTSPNLDVNEAYAPESGIMKSMHVQATGGVQSSPSCVLFFNVPKDGWYRFDLAGSLKKRGSETAGYVEASVYLLDAEGKKCRSLNEFNLNTRNGYGPYPQAMSSNGSLALKAGWRLAVRVRVVSPGPAPGGIADFAFDKFLVERLVSK